MKMRTERKNISLPQPIGTIGLRKDFDRIDVQTSTSSAYQLQASGLAERKNRSQLSKGYAILIESDMNKQLRGEALLQACYLHN